MSAPNPKFPASTRSVWLQDILIVSSFAVWVAVLGLSPVLVFHALKAV